MTPVILLPSARRSLSSICSAPCLQGGRATDGPRVRTELCPEYMKGAREILGHAQANHSTAFPLGAGGGGGILVFSPDPDALSKLRGIFQGVYREIPIKIQNKGHKFINFPIKGR